MSRLDNSLWWFFLPWVWLFALADWGTSEEPITYRQAYKSQWELHNYWYKKKPKPEDNSNEL